MERKIVNEGGEKKKFNNPREDPSNELSEATAVAVGQADGRTDGRATDSPPRPAACCLLCNSRFARASSAAAAGVVFFFLVRPDKDASDGEIGSNSSLHKMTSSVWNFEIQVME